MKLNRKWILVLSLVLSVAMATGGTLAYLTDRDSEANVFTFGNVSIDLSETFEQGAELIPGVKIEKKPVITNTGKNDAWVWATIAIPAALDNDNASMNVLHFNYDKDHVNGTEWTWQRDGQWIMQTKNIGDPAIEYNVYTVLYQTALKNGKSTSPVMTQVYLDYHVDIDPDGNMYHVENGEIFDLNWNVNEQKVPTMYISAYAMQKDQFDNVQAAYDAYNAQWGANGTEWGEPLAPVSSEKELLEALRAGQNIKLLDDIELSEGRIDVGDGQEIVIDMNGKTITDTKGGSSMTAWVKKGGKLTITGNGTIKKVNHSAHMIYFDGELNIMNGTFAYEPYTWGECTAESECKNAHGTNALKVGSIVVGRKGTEYAGVLNIYGGTFDCGIMNPEAFLSNNSEINDKNKPVTMYAVINSHAGHPMDATIYGGTFVSANPAGGDVNKPYTLYLAGQTMPNVIPAGYTIVEGRTEDGRLTYTVNYNK